jgi:protein involved in polysaccharide export with SLBB domain
MTSPFDHRRDPEIAEALREVLSSPDDLAFARRVEAAAAAVQGQMSRSGWWDVLGTWARPGVAAALALAGGATLWLALASLGPNRDVTIEEALRRAGEDLAPAIVVAGAVEVELDRVMWEVPDPE